MTQRVMAICPICDQDVRARVDDGGEVFARAHRTPLDLPCPGSGKSVDVAETYIVPDPRG